MEKILAVLKHNRKVYTHFLDRFSLEELNAIPKGFNNNIIWNIAHVLVTQQLLMYKLSGLPLHVSEEMVERYRKGTKPEGKVDQREVEEIKTALLSTYEALKADLEQEKFKNFHPYTTSSKMELTTFEEASSFVLFHDGIHVGAVLALARCL